MNDTRFVAPKSQTAAAGSAYSSILPDLAATEFSRGFLGSIGVQHIAIPGESLGGRVAASLTTDHLALEGCGRWPQREDSDTLNRPHLDFLRAAHQNWPRR